MTTPHPDAWDALSAPPPSSVVVRGASVIVGQRVRLRPAARADVMDAALAGRTAVVETIDVTTDGEIHFGVTVDDDPGRDLGGGRCPAHRFFFRDGEIEVIDESAVRSGGNSRVLIAGIGNIFFGDDGFGVAVARHLSGASLRSGVTVRDFGIRGLDLAYALQDEFDAAILIDAMPRGGTPGTIYVVEPLIARETRVEEARPDPHGLDPVHVLRLARSLGRLPARVFVVGCEPETVELAASSSDALLELSSPVAAAVVEAARVVETLCRDLEKAVVHQ
jgi:hydrogenase maturation protease